VWVDRIRTGRFFDAVDRLVQSVGREVDLVELERAPKSLREAIERTGVEIDA
jgi:hypothetical protein